MNKQELCLNPQITTSNTDSLDDPLATLSPREREVIQLVGCGKTSKEIADALAISVGTVASHWKRLCREIWPAQHG
jgi:RNA polymerase sigma factor (sigma-70 family)